MLEISHLATHPRLLVSVRDAAEASVALNGGAQIIDVKEPSRGALGRAESATVASVVQAVAGSVPVSMALGELTELLAAGKAVDPAIIPVGVKYFKIGLANCGDVPNWQHAWRDVVDQLRARAEPVAVIYADWRIAGAPSPDEILSAGIALQCRTYLIDTWSKGSGNLFVHWEPDLLQQFCRRLRPLRLAVAVAGSLAGESLEAAARMRPDIIAVRGAACVAGRESRVSAAKVSAIREAIKSALDQSSASRAIPYDAANVGDTSED